MTLPVNPIRKKRSVDTGYAESNRKTQAFYTTLITVVALFLSSPITGLEPSKVIDSLVQLASIFIGGLAIADSVRYHKFGSNTLGNPEKVNKENELKERYTNR